MKQRRVRYTETAQEHVWREERWWLENRDYPEVFADEFEFALRSLALLPGAGTRYPDAGVPGLRRIYLTTVACHIYYTFDDREVISGLTGAHLARLRHESYAGPLAIVGVSGLLGLAMLVAAYRRATHKRLSA